MHSYSTIAHRTLLHGLSTYHVLLSYYRSPHSGSRFNFLSCTLILLSLNNSSHPPPLVSFVLTSYFTYLPHYSDFAPSRLTYLTTFYSYLRSSVSYLKLQLVLLTSYQHYQHSCSLQWSVTFCLSFCSYLFYYIIY